MIDLYTASSWGCSVLFPSELDESMLRSLKVVKCVIGSILGFIHVDGYVKCHFLTKLCCYQKVVSMYRFILKGEKSIYGISF